MAAGLCKERHWLNPYDCGNFDLAVRLLNQIAEYVKIQKMQPQLIIDETSLQVCFMDKTLQAPSLAQLTLARELSLRVG